MAFFIYDHSLFETVPPAVTHLFEKMGLNNPWKKRCDKYTMISWRKHLLDETLHLEMKGYTICCAGTLIYRGCATLAESLHRVLSDIISGNFDFKKTRGVYALIISDPQQKLSMVTDQSGIQNIYFAADGKLASSSFLATVLAVPGKVTINHLAATELLATTGRLIGPDTLVNEVQRYEHDLHSSIGPIHVIRSEEIARDGKPENQTKRESVNTQINVLHKYFEDIKPFAEHYGVDTGLTGGHDSRMMLILLRKFFKKFQVHTFWRKKKDVELACAEKVAEKAGIQLKIVKARHHFDKTAEEMDDNLQQAFLFYDGHIRLHCFLTEEYNTLQHRAQILGECRFGINGVGGEQYRNEEHMEAPVWTLTYFLRYYLTYTLSGKSFDNYEEEEKYFIYLRNKISQKLGIGPSDKFVSHRQVKKYLNEVYVASLMGARTNAENKLAHFVTPYIDRQLTLESYNALPHLGVSYGFQQAMIRTMDPELAGVVSGYGYNFLEGEPVKMKLKYYLKELTPRDLYVSRLEKAMAAKGNNEFEQFMNKYPSLRHGVELIRKLRLPLDEDKITSIPDMPPVYLGLGYFIQYLVTIGKLETSSLEPAYRHN